MSEEKIESKFVVGDTTSGIEIEIRKSEHDIYYINKWIWVDCNIVHSSVILFSGNVFEEFKNMVNKF